MAEKRIKARIKIKATKTNFSSTVRKLMAPETNSCSKILKVTQNNCSHLGMWRACKNTLKIVFFVRKNKKWLHAILQMTMRTGEYSTIVSWLLRGRLLILDSPLSQIIIYGNTLMLLNSKQEHTPEIRILLEKSDKCFKAVRWKTERKNTIMYRKSQVKSAFMQIKVSSNQKEIKNMASKIVLRRLWIRIRINKLLLIILRSTQY